MKTFNFDELQTKSGFTRAANEWEELVRQHVEDYDEFEQALVNSTFWREAMTPGYYRLFGTGAQEYTRFVWNPNTGTWIDIEEVPRMLKTHQAPSQ